jgi:hypothetical protein
MGLRKLINMEQRRGTLNPKVVPYHRATPQASTGDRVLRSRLLDEGKHHAKILFLA